MVFPLEHPASLLKTWHRTDSGFQTFRLAILPVPKKSGEDLEQLM
jgi:hypothetical protein